VSETAGLPIQPTFSNDELHAFLEELPGHLKGGRLEELRDRCRALLERAPDAAGERWARLTSALRELRAALESGAARAYLLARYEDTARAYEHWRNAQTAESARSLAPLIGARSYFHMAMGLLATGMYQFVLSRAQAVTILLTVLGVFGTLEITRRIWPRWNDVLVNRVFKHIVRPREYHKVNSATYYLVALCLLTPFFSRPALLSGVLVLAFGDPAAAWIGKAFGRRKLYGKKSLAGSLAFLAAGSIAAGVFLVACYPALPLGLRLLTAVSASFAGALAELFSSRLDDNLTVPIAAVLAASIFL
jgi:dolichol kinase